MDEPHLKILHMIQEGIISAEEGEKLLDALDWGVELDGRGENGILGEAPAMVKATETIPAGPPAWVEWAWIYLLAGGILILGLAVIFTALLVQGGVHPVWLAFTLPLMVFGALVAGVAWWSRTARWLRVRVRDADTRISFSLPLPLRPVAWLVRAARPWVPQLQDTPIDELILLLSETEGEGILAVEVNEDEGEEVSVYFG
jgi:hypothetical protein